MQVAPTDYEISIISGSYGGHRQHKRHDGQSQGFDIGLSCLTQKPLKIIQPSCSHEENIGKCRFYGQKS